MIVYGYVNLLHTRYCPLKKFNLCGKCKENRYVLNDGIGDFTILSNKDCTTTILNGKRLNLTNELDKLENINVFRLQFTIETKDEVKDIINKFKNNQLEFNEKTDTRGHFNRKII